VAKAKVVATERGVSMNQVLVDVLAREFGDAGGRKSNGLDRFSGSCPDCFGEDWAEYLKELKLVNPEDWK